MQIWIEDSTVGYNYWSKISKYLFEDKFLVKGFKGNKDLLHHLQSYSEDEFIYLIVDSMCDNSFTKRTYERIEKEVLLHKNVVLGVYGCTERAFLSFNYIDKMAYNHSNKLDWIKNYILDNTNIFDTIDFNILNDSQFIDYCNNSVELDKLGNINSERVFKSLLSQYTNNTQASIHSSYIGPCWYKPCCILNMQKKCGIMEIQNEERDKLDYICLNSEFYFTILDLEKKLNNFINSYYHYTRYDNNYKEICMNKLTFLELAYLIDDYIRNGYVYWNYERISVYGGLV